MDALEHVGSAWDVVKRDLVAWVVLALAWTLSLLACFLGLVLSVNLLRATARALEDGARPSVGDLFDTRNLLDDLVLLALVVVANAIGSAVPVVGTLAVATLMLWVPMLVVDGHYGPLEAVMVSARAVVKDPLPALVFTLVTLAILVGTAALCGFPLLVGLPVVLAASWRFYEAERAGLLEVGDAAGVARR